jgi:cytochrome c551/c552
MPVLRKVLPALLCALSLGATACGADSGGSGSGSAGASTGDDLYRRYACASCHSLDGSDGTGPTFKGLAGSTRTLEGGERTEATSAYLSRAISDPDAEIVEGYSAGLMTSSIDGFDLGSRPEDVARLVEFIEGVN